MRKIILLAAFALAASAASAQVKLGQGQISGSFETSTAYYVDDKGTGAAAPEDRFGSNNYLKVDFSWHKLSAGIQLEGYFPTLQGFDMGDPEINPDVKKFILGSKYVQWQDRNFGVLVGNVYDQFGNGLIFRSYEDRALGFNNSLEGVQASYRFNNYVAVKAMYGRPRLYMEYADSWVRGADLSVSLGDIVGKPELLLTLEGSYVNRYEKLAAAGKAFGLTNPNLNMYSGRLNFDYAGVSLRAEYVHKGKDVPSFKESPAATTGKAVYGELGYHYKGLSIAATFRLLDNMKTMSTLRGPELVGSMYPDMGTGNTLNYLPALTRQYTYMLANLAPYQVCALGEMGGQVDVNYTLRSKASRYRYWAFHANFSTFYTLRPEQSVNNRRELLWRDINVDVERQWSKTWKTSLLFTRQEWNPSYGSRDEIYASNTVVGDATCKFNRKMSLRFEVQYLNTPVKGHGDYGFDGDWVAALVEFNMAPHWSFYASDMYNYGGSNKHYYNAGVSYTHTRTRVQLSYGRNRAGYVCSGGVCRYQPAYTGVSLVLTSSF